MSVEGEAKSVLDAALARLNKSVNIMRPLTYANESHFHPGRETGTVSVYSGAYKAPSGGCNLYGPITDLSNFSVKRIVTEKPSWVASVHTYRDSSGRKFMLNPGESKLGVSIPPYYRLSFGTLPGTREGIAAQKAAALNYLAAYVKRYDQLFSSNAQWFTVHASEQDRTMISGQWKASLGGGTPSMIHYSRPSSWGKMTQAEFERHVVRRPDPALETSSIESFYNTLMNNIQNEVLDQLVKLHPSVTWRDRPFAVASMDSVLTGFDLDLDPTVEWRDRPWYSDDYLDSITYEEDYPSEDISDSEVALLLVTKATWLVALFNDILARHQITDETGDISRAALVNMVKADAGREMWKRLDESGLTKRALSVVETLDDTLKEFVELGFQAFSSPESRVVTLMEDAITQASSLGRDFHRGTLVLTCPGRTQMWLRESEGSLRLLDVLGITSADLLKSSETRLYKLLHERLPRLLVALASGALVVGHPGLLALQSYAITVKRYGFNVVVDQAPKDVIRSAVLKITRLRADEVEDAAALAAIRNADPVQTAMYWANLLHVSAEEDGTMHLLGDEGDAKTGYTFQDCALLYTHNSSLPNSSYRFNPEPVITKLDLL